VLGPIQLFSSPTLNSFKLVFILLNSNIFKQELFLSEQDLLLALTQCCTVHGLGPRACSNSELISEIMNHFTHLGKIPWTGDRPIATTVPT